MSWGIERERIRCWVLSSTHKKNAFVRFFASNLYEEAGRVPLPPRGVDPEREL